MIIGAAMEKVTVPVEEIACKTPTEAEELCRIAVISAPTATPKSGFLNKKKIRWNCSESFNGASVVSIVVIPTNKMPKPIRIEAKSLALFFFDTKRIAAPTAMHKGAKEDGFSSIKKILSLEIWKHLLHEKW